VTYPSPDRPWCECGLLSSDIEFCGQPGDTTYDSSCTGWLCDVYYNPITTYVSQEWPGGPCAGAVDCIYHNCANGTCGGEGATCDWLRMCQEGLDCTDRVCRP
jgi:hypothetical protein